MLRNLVYRPPRSREKDEKELHEPGQPGKMRFEDGRVPLSAKRYDRMFNPYVSRSSGRWLASYYVGQPRYIPALPDKKKEEEEEEEEELATALMAGWRTDKWVPTSPPDLTVTAGRSGWRNTPMASADSADSWWVLLLVTLGTGGFISLLMIGAVLKSILLLYH
ncbi:hypothetical protein DFP73DRAFT_551721 [Morchella snyderi]|nr:hypothetical protein DFP73DRAFT_551721 [Morchella snyderi]